MSKTIVREYDNSTSGIPSSNNFTVALAGFAGTPAAGYSADWDENDCAEFTSQADFINKVGLVGMSGTAGVSADANALEVINEASDGIARYTTSINRTEFESDGVPSYKYLTALSDSTDIYRLNSSVSKDSDTGIYCYSGTGNTKYYFYTYDTYQSTETVKYTYKAGYGMLDLNADVVSDADKVYYKLNPVTDITTLLDIYDDTAVNTQYTVKADVQFVCVTDRSKLGSDSIGFKHKGNQIAYELLGLGFPVIYKRISASCDEKEFISADFWSCFRDKSLYNFRYIMTGWAADEATNVAACNQITTIANFNNQVTLENAETIDDSNGRGDCVALCDFAEDGIDTSTMSTLVSTTGQAIKALSGNKYNAIFGPRVIYPMTDAEANLFEGGDSAKTFPGSFHYLACVANALGNYNEWYAAAGYTRGIAARSVAATTIKYGSIANNTLSPRVLNAYTDKAVNLICYDRGNYILKGNRTGQILNKSGLTYSHYLNIRQLCTTIKKRLQSICDQLAYDPNSDILWHNFVAAVTPTLEAMKADQGISGYKITKVTTSAKGVVKAKIRIVPIEAVEDFDISLSLEDSLDGISISTDETEE